MENTCESKVTRFREFAAELEKVNKEALEKLEGLQRANKSF